MASRATRWLAGLAIVGVIAAGCGDNGGDDTSGNAAPVIDPGDGGDYAPVLEPADFVDVIDNPFLPLLPGSRWVYQGESDGETERIEVVVTDERRTVMGAQATVVRDTVTDADGALVEDTFDWFAQDRDGNVWYLGEDSREYEDGQVASTEGSWEAGVDGALPGIVMPAQPTVGFAYRQEYYAGEAEDMAEVVRVDEAKTVRFGDFDDVVVTRDWNPLEPDVVEEKYYAPGVGLIFETKTVGGEEHVELIQYTRGEP
ncbi:MAG: hypothetical protein ACRD0N_09950 [Acidimicrobiales bacterium]